MLPVMKWQRGTEAEQWLPLPHCSLGVCLDRAEVVGMKGTDKSGVRDRKQPKGKSLPARDSHHVLAGKDKLSGYCHCHLSFTVTVVFLSFPKGWILGSTHGTSCSQNLAVLKSQVHTPAHPLHTKANMLFLLMRLQESNSLLIFSPLVNVVEDRQMEHWSNIVKTNRW